LLLLSMAIALAMAAPTGDGSGTTIQIPLTNSNGVQFYAELTVGTPPQTFKVSPNTAFMNTILPSADCDLKQKVCASKAHYKNFNSTSYVGDGTAWANKEATNVTGFLSIDTMKIGAASVKYQTFVEASSLENDDLAASPFDGVFGLGFENAGDSKSFLHNLVDAKQIGQASFGISINRDTTKPTESSISLGGVDNSKFKGQMVQFLVMGQETMIWGIPLNSLFVGGSFQSYQLSCTAVVNPAFQFIGFPQAAADWVHTQLGATTISAGKYAFDCTKVDKLPDLKIRISNVQGQPVDHIITKDDYVSITETPVGKFCLSEIVALNPNPDGNCVLGVPFMAKYYSYFETNNTQQNRATMSFAPVNV